MNATPDVIDDGADRLGDVWRIHALKAHYCRCIDQKLWDELAALFCADARFEGFGSAPSGADVATFVGGVSTRLANAVTVHHCHMPELRFTSADEARGLWPMMDIVQWPAGFEPAEMPGASGFAGHGYYEELYRREQGRWKIAFMRLVRLRLDPVTAPLRPLGAGRLPPTKGWLDAAEAACRSQ